ncbi:alpha-1,6-mannosylglycoprotein 6-beta-N-acetylglucosaminyltransferase B [Osmerus mordax]|uniref:alpha-1,6-mannosylglycoprotein 6-beta-N-acetylglucosaminyltransferase B n=1 Tax=Osmerus mordax TaxID=8014 RepID=UPI00350F0C01
MARRCLLTVKPFRIFVAGISFFSLFLVMTSLGGHLLARRQGDSPFTVRAEVLGGPESRLVLKRISEMLEAILKRMDHLTSPSSPSPSLRLQQLSHALHRIQPLGLVERIQAIAQNVSDMAEKVERILQHSLDSNRGRGRGAGLCVVPDHPQYPHCRSKVDWMRSRWISDPCYAFYGVDGSDCSFLSYLSQVERFCPPAAWRNQSAPPSTYRPPSPPPRIQAGFRADVGPLLEQLGCRKEAFCLMRRRVVRLASLWSSAARRLDDRLRHTWRQQKKVLVHVGFLTEESGDTFSSRVLKGGPLGELVQWADIMSALHMLGHDLSISVSQRELQGFLGVRPGRGSCPLTGGLPFDLIYTDYHGLQHLKRHMGLSLRTHRCHLRVIDSFGTEPVYNHEEYATQHGYITSWGHWNLSPGQYMTMFPHTPDNSFMGFVAEEPNNSERSSIRRNKAHNMAVIYGKEAAMWKGKEKFLSILHEYMEVHGTVYSESQRPLEVPAFVQNHGLLGQHDLQLLLRRAKLFVGFGFPYEGPAPLEAIANGCIFLQPKFTQPHSSLNHEFFKGKPTSRQVSSQHPYAEQHIGKPHVFTVDFNSSQQLHTAIREIMRTKVEPFLPYEYSCEGMLERVHAYIHNQDFCSPQATFPPVNMSSVWPGSPPSPFVLLPSESALSWASNVRAPPSWPPLSSLRLLASLEGQSCVEACKRAGLICEPSYFHYINIREAFRGLKLQCVEVEEKEHPVCPAFTVGSGACCLQKEPLLSSCAGAGPEQLRLCPCRGYRKGQVALCPHCL